MIRNIVSGTMGTFGNLSSPELIKIAVHFTPASENNPISSQNFNEGIYNILKIEKDIILLSNSAASESISKLNFLGFCRFLFFIILETQKPING